MKIHPLDSVSHIWKTCNYRVSEKTLHSHISFGHLGKYNMLLNAIKELVRRYQKCLSFLHMFLSHTQYSILKGSAWLAHWS